MRRSLWFVLEHSIPTERGCQRKGKDDMRKSPVLTIWIVKLLTANVLVLPSAQCNVASGEDTGKYRTTMLTKQSSTDETCAQYEAKKTTLSFDPCQNSSSLIPSLCTHASRAIRADPPSERHLEAQQFYHTLAGLGCCKTRCKTLREVFESRAEVGTSAQKGDLSKLSRRTTADFGCDFWDEEHWRWKSHLRYLILVAESNSVLSPHEAVLCTVLIAA